MKRIAVIGLGTLGSSICKNIAEMDIIDELVLVDYDIVESKNIYNSIYIAEHIGETKVDALSDIIRNNINIIPIIEKYEEGKTILPKCDLILDCRDVVCSRADQIDARLYITGKILIIDCRKNITSQYNYSGSYRQVLTKNELNKAGFFAAQIICSNEIKSLQRNRSVQRIDLDLLPSMINEALTTTNKDKVDIIYDMVDGSERLHCLEENIKPILTLTKNNDIDVYIGERNPQTDLPQLFSGNSKTKYAVIPRRSLKNSTDLINSLSKIVKEQNNILNYIVTVRRENDETFIELLEETGAA